MKEKAVLANHKDLSNIKNTIKMGDKSKVMRDYFL